ncbi:Protein of unknown function [Quadrisphaera granulorum]|uniref:Uncharacterized protein DUF3159 n=1 Tax=Quadrisphaera granulorum TaxID=317664 RepID=A0A315ZVF2_9ACTN|nr:DUF3159 domain-containing protein [Quadrisphaera granulorum]PWJ49289.1 uncharacterized protein DUF3159 [Quadrisphaera granulorum]SZE98206.1 Protein of unknown function [Quadrisphaera granulorum]
MQSGVGRAATAERFSLADAVGGPRGAAEAVLPGLVFVIVVTVTRSLPWACGLALGVAGLAALARLVARQPLQQALAGAVGVGVCALTAWRTGDAVDFYSWGLLLNAVYAVVLAISTLPLPKVGPLPGGPLPVTGLLVAAARGGGAGSAPWRHDPAQMRLHRRLTWMWVGLFALRLAVQTPLYVAGAVTALGVARLVMGLPLFAAAAWVTWLALRRVDGGVSPAAGPAAPAERTPEAPAGP